MIVSENNKYLAKGSFDGKEYAYIDINKAANDLGMDILKLPYSLRVLFENVVRSTNDHEVLSSFKEWLDSRKSGAEVPYRPARVLMQDFTGVPAVVDLASMRDAMVKLGGDPKKINPLIPVDLVIDHSLQVDVYGNAKASEINVDHEVTRNRERYEFLKWGQNSFDNFKVVPPGTGICHQVNLEYLAQTVWMGEHEGKNVLYPDTLVGTDSHTTMINALSVLGWGVGGIEAEAAMLGQSIPMILPEVVGFKLTGKLEGNITATDMVLTITEALRKKGVVGKFVEFFGPGLESMSLADRATISNMAPEYGATCGFFSTDDETLRYLRLSGRDEHRVKVVEEYAKMQSLWRGEEEAMYTDVLELDISTLSPSLAGPKRPQDRVDLIDVQSNFKENLKALNSQGNDSMEKFHVPDESYMLGQGDVVIAAITSCTNTSNPSVMVAAALVAKKAVELGITIKPWVKTSLAPGSKVVTEYLDQSGLSEYLDKIGFNLVGYGCTTCIGNSGPLNPNIDSTINDHHLVVSSVLSGNRNFEGRVHPHVRANYLASPPLVVAYALAGTLDVNLEKDPIGQDEAGNDVYLKDLWPSQGEIKSIIDKFISAEMFEAKYADVFAGDEHWQKIKITESDTYSWSSDSTYINNPPYFDGIEGQQEAKKGISGAKILALFGDSITTDHISPAGVISKNSPAAKYLVGRGVDPHDFNSYGSRRGNHEVMMRGTFANVRIKNLLCPGTEGGVTINHLNGDQTSIYDAAMSYRDSNVPLVIFAGKEYGTGSSRDWAAKGTNLLGVKAVIAESFERIHRSNLVGMGVLPMKFTGGLNWKDLGIKGDEEISILGLEDNLKPYGKLQLEIKSADSSEIIDVTLDVHTDNEIEYINHGSILGAVVKNLHNN